MTDITITAPGSATPELAAEVAALARQLSSTAAPFTLDLLARITASPATTLLVARDGEGRAVGMLTLVMFPIPTGLRAIIEDVVVDGAARNMGIGEMLTLGAVRRASAAGARTVDLSSRPSREAANRLYVRAGFAQRETAVYRRTL